MHAHRFRRLFLPGLVIAGAFLSLPVVFPLRGAELPTRRVDIHVDGKRPIAGERSRFAVSPRGEIAFSYTLAAGRFSCKPLGLIDKDNRLVRMSAVDSESTWNVEGWATYGWPFDLAFDTEGELHVATRHRGQPYGVDYWRKVDGLWRLESFGAGVTYGGNTVSLKLLPDGRPVVVCLDRNRTQLAVWERNESGEWSATRPAELGNVASGQFDLVVHKDGVLRVFFCPLHGGPVCATRDADRKWTRNEIVSTAVSRMIAATLDHDALHVSFAVGERSNNIRELHYATLTDNGKWNEQTVATASDGRHVGLTDIAAAAGRIAIAWEQGAGPQFAPKDYGGKVGSTMLTLLGDQDAVTHELVEENAGRPAVVLTPDGTTAWVGVYSGNEAGDDFYLLQCRLEDRKPAETRVVNGRPADIFREGCLKDIDSGNAKAQRRGIQRIDLTGVTAEHRLSLIERFLNHQDPVIRKSIARELARSPEAVAHFSDRLTAVLDDPDRLVRKTFLEQLAAGEADSEFVKAVFERAIVSSDAMTRLTAAEVLRKHPDWVRVDELSRGIRGFHRDLDSVDATVAGSAAMALERVIEIGGLREKLQLLVRTGSPLQRVRAALILFRCGDAVDISQLAEIPPPSEQDSQEVSEKKRELAQLALCGLLGQLRTAPGVPLLERCLQSDFSSVRSASVFALRSVAHLAVLKPVAKHPKGFDLLALRAIEPVSKEEHRTWQTALAALMAALQHSDANVRQKACDALGRIRAKEATNEIRRLLDDQDPGVRIAAKTAVSVLTGRSATALVDHSQWQESSANRSGHRPANVHRPPTVTTDGVVQVGSDKQLLIDDLIIENSSGLTRRLHPFKKYPRNPVFHAQVPWEEGWADPFMSTVIYDSSERCFKMWYRCGPRHSLKGYAVSADGIHWERPNIARSDWQNYEDHNLVGFDGRIATWQKPGNNVLFFPEADEADRFLSLFYQPPTSDYAVSRSANGIDWKPPQSVRHAYGDVVSLVRDPGREKYLFFPKYNREHDGFVRRSFAATTLDELASSFPARFPFLAGHRDDSRVADDATRAYGSLLPNTLRLSEFHSEIYSVTAIPYEGVVVALYDLWAVTGSREGPLDMPMKISRDMKTWHDVDYPRRALSIGRFGEWDSGMVYGGNTMLVVDDQIRLYYLGANMGHCTRILPTTKPYHSLGVGLATLRLDGFASLRATAKSGEFTTKPISIRGDRLQINALCAAEGSIKVELLDSTGKPIPGFSVDDCESFTGDSIRHSVSWRGNTSIPELSGPIRLRAVLSSADLFAFQFVPAVTEP